MEVGLVIGIAMAAISIPLGLYARSRVIKQLRANLPASPIQTLERRLAAGEISPEQYRYERYLLEKPD